MTELAYMTLSDWGQEGTTMEAQGTRIREWLGKPPFVAATPSMKGYTGSLDREVVDSIAPAPTDQAFVEIQRLRELFREKVALPEPVIALRPFEESDCDLIARLVREQLLGKVFVMVHHHSYPIRVWLDAMQATNLHTGTIAEAATPVLLEAARSIKGEDYNGLSSGNGKATIVQLVRALAEHGHPVDPELWTRAYFAVGGSFRHAATVSKLVTEMRQGTKHRVKDRYRPEIYDILLERAEASAPIN